MYKGKIIQYRRLGKQKLFEIRWRRNVLSEKVRTELNAKAWVRGRFAESHKRIFRQRQTQVQSPRGHIMKENQRMWSKMKKIISSNHFNTLCGNQIKHLGFKKKNASIVWELNCKRLNELEYPNFVPYYRLCFKIYFVRLGIATPAFCSFLLL